MTSINLLWPVVIGIGTLFLFILRLKWPAFISLLISSIIVGLAAGMPVENITSSIQKGMGSTLGFVAVVVGLGAMFGAILEHSGGAKALSERIIKQFGQSKASWGMMLIGFIIAIPVFFDVAFIIMAPMLYSLQKKTKKSLLFFAIPLLASLVIAHAFIPPTPGPVAVADILKADLGRIILLGMIVGLPTAIICGPIFGKYISNKIWLDAPDLTFDKDSDSEKKKESLPSALSIILIIFLPILLIVLQTLLKDFETDNNALLFLKQSFKLIGHPFTALIIANILAWYILGINRGMSSEKLLNISSKSMQTAGIIILLTGAGGVFKQILVDTKIGEQLAEQWISDGSFILIISFLCAVIIRLLQGSATVAMITAAGIISPLIANDYSSGHLALLVLAIAAGTSTTSHVNDSGFWLVKEYLGMTESQTLRSWTTMTALISLVGLMFILLVSLVVS